MILTRPPKKLHSAAAAAATSHRWRWLSAAPPRVRLKWVKSRGLDHIIERDTDIKAAVLLKDFISRAPGGHLSARFLAADDRCRRALGLTVPVLRFLRRYPTLFSEAPHHRYPSLPCFSLAPAADLLNNREISIYQIDSSAAAARISRLLMMSKSRSLPVSTILPLRYDLGLPANFATSLSAARPDLLSYNARPNPTISLTDWPPELAISKLQQMHSSTPDYRDLKKSPFSSSAPLTFPMRFPRGYGGMNKVKAWMEEFHRLPYISPYEDASGIDPDSELAEKRAVGVLHELLSLTIHRKTHRNYLRGLREELGLPHKFTRLFTKYPGIFYFSLKCKTTTVVLREGYEKGKLVDPHPLALLRSKYHYVMRTGVLYRGKGTTKLVLDDDSFMDRDGNSGDVAEENEDDDTDDDGDECYEMETDNETESEDD